MVRAASSGTLHAAQGAGDAWGRGLGGRRRPTSRLHRTLAALAGAEGPQRPC